MMSFPSWLRSLNSSHEPAARATRRPKRSLRPKRGPRLRLEILEDRTLPSAYLVTTTADSGPGSLRDAINQINADTSHTLYPSPNNSSVDEIDFNITAASDTAGGFNATTGVATIAPLSPLPTVINAVLINGYVQAGASPNTLTVGDNAVLKIDLSGAQAISTNGINGLTIAAAGCTVQGLAVNGFTRDGIQLQGGDTVEGNFIGTDATGTQVVGNFVGVESYGLDNVVGGTTPDARNIISGNGLSPAIPSNTTSAAGVWEEGTGDIIEGNYIGTDATGTIALGDGPTVTNYGGGGIYMPSVAHGTTIGGTAPGAGNLISGNGTRINGANFNSGPLPVIQGNLIGTDATGTKALGNDTGLALDGPFLIGGTTPSARNIISGNGYGIATNGGVVEGNYIGTDITGTVAVGNSAAGIYDIQGTAITIGGTAPGAGNLISGNNTGILLAKNSVIQGNLIGTDYTGTKTVGNGSGLLYLGNNNLIGGTTQGARNVISGNGNGIVVSGPGNIIEGSYIGTDITGGVGIGGGGVTLSGGASNDTIGGTTAAARNVISGGAGISINNGGGALPSNNVVEGNYTGTDATGSYALGGFVAIDSGTNNVIGGNVIAACGGRAGVGLENFAGSDQVITGNVIQGNLIGTDATGMHTTDPNGHSFGGVFGVEINNGLGYSGDSGNLVGGTSPGQGNAIAGNSSAGVEVSNSSQNAIRGNSIFDNGGLGIQLANGANDNQAAPLLTAVYYTSGATIFIGTITSTPDATVTVQFFANTASDPEGRTLLGSQSVKTDASGNGSFAVALSAALPAGQSLVTATATDPNGNTSEFSAGVTATPLPPSSLSGVVWQDFNNDGQVDFGENGIGGVTITLTGTDFLGNAVNLSQLTDGDGAYVFLNLLPGNYYITETLPAGYPQGIDSVGTAGGSVVAAGQFFVQIGVGVNGLNYNFGEQPPAGGKVQDDQAAGIGFWNNKHGQALIDAFNGGSGHQLADWLAATLPHIFGVNAGSNDLAGQSNAVVAALFQQDFLMKGVKLDAELLATALSVYATNATLDSTQVAAQYGFTVSGTGLGTDTVNVRNNGDAFGVANDTTMTVVDLLVATDAQAVDGLLYNGSAAKRNEANNVYSALNQGGSS